LAQEQSNKSEQMELWDETLLAEKKGKLMEEPMEAADIKKKGRVKEETSGTSHHDRLSRWATKSSPGKQT